MELTKLPALKFRLCHKKFVKCEEVVLFKADANYTEVVLLSGKRVVISKTMKEVEQRFIHNTSFFRTHKSYMVNLAHVIGFKLHEGMLVRLINDETASVSRRRKLDFLQVFQKQSAASA